MLDNPGLYMVNAIEVQRIAEKYSHSGWRVISLPAEIASQDQFYDAIRSKCPLDPPLYNNRSWDALADSLWSGLDKVKDERVVILWPGVDRMKAVAPEAFVIATDILTDLCVSLADPNVMGSKTKTLLVFQAQS